MDLSNIILTKLPNKLTPPAIEFLDLETEKGKPIKTPERTLYASNLGRTSPLLVVGNARIASSNIAGMTIFYDEFLPRIHVTITDNTGSMTSVNYPKTNPLMTVYIAPNHAKLKSLTQTFLITDVQSMQLTNDVIRYDLFGELYVPKINSNFVKSYSGMTSQQALLKIAEELGLGFASNEETFNDSMTWINPNLNYQSFIKTIASHAYKNETSFFDCFIDRSYNLTMVNVDTQLKPYDEKETPEMGYSGPISDILDLARVKNGVKTDSDEALSPLVLGTWPVADQNSDLAIREFSVMGENGGVLKRSGFRKKVKFYQHGEQNPVKDWFVEPISKPSNNGVLGYPKPELTDYTENAVVKWMGTDYGNSHANYKFARLLNSHNCEDIEKTTLKVKLAGVNHNIARGSRIIVKIYSSQLRQIGLKTAADDLTKVDNKAEKIDSNARGQVFYEDEYLSGAYYVKSIVYDYGTKPDSHSSFSTTMILTRREWLPEPKMKINT